MYGIIYFSIIINVVLVFGKHEEYKEYKVYNVHVTKQTQLERIQKMHSDIVDFWRKPSLKYNVTGRAMVPPSHFDFFEQKLKELEIPLDVYIEDVYDYLNEKDSQLEAGSRNTVDGYLNRYYRYDEILEHLHTVEDTYASTEYELEIVEHGLTEENRPILYVKISSAVPKPIIVIEAGINPREWITIPSALYVIDKLIDADNINLLNNFDWIIIPILNPDGYEYTHTNLRLWQKNRSTQSNLGFICPGANIDRNFDMDWLHFDSSSSPCSHLYAGVEPFSEVETQLIKNLFEQHEDRIQMYVSLQNCGGFITYPWNYERAASGMFRENHLVGLDMAELMKEAYGVDAGSLVFDRASGTSTDFARDKGVLFSYNIGIVERDGVVIPEGDIGIITEDVWLAIKTAANGLLELNN